MPLWSINIIVALLSFAVAAIFGKALIPFLHKLKFGQPIKMKFGPEWHAKKQGTPTMGGILFIFSTAVAVGVGYCLYRTVCNDSTVSGTEYLDWNRGIQMLSCMIFAILFGLIGFIDDFKKVVQKKNDGLSPMQKIVLQVVVAAAWLGVQYWLGDRDTTLNFSFFSFDLSWFYYPLMLVVILYLTNAVNLTDGVDGLCGTVTMVNMLLMTIICVLLSLQEMSIFTIALAGGCLGFLVWNLHPAKCFMGDTGSMYLGASVVSVGLVTHRHLVLLLVALLYILEALSVVIQVSYFKYTKKKYGEGRRIFKMTPIHHHFELSGFSEYKIVITFSLFALVMGILGLLLVLFV
ncbi:MAG: phospho-N-acetylmuramoyl-pentapeptide-transferase [Oscillospiraceae bacterium]|nr:phospho-N-acetylmuramoyl-pentapeptide-transferase [Oscillospiraceae bacterium]